MGWFLKGKGVTEPILSNHVALYMPWPKDRSIWPKDK